MDAEVTFSEPVNCEHCGEKVRVRYVDGEVYSIAEPDPIPGTESKNPVYPVHQCS